MKNNAKQKAFKLTLKENPADTVSVDGYESNFVVYRMKFELFSTQIKDKHKPHLTLWSCKGIVLPCSCIIVTDLGCWFEILIFSSTSAAGKLRIFRVILARSLSRIACLAPDDSPLLDD